MKLLKSEIYNVAGGVNQKDVTCENGYLSAIIHIPPHPASQLLGIVIAIPGTDAYKEIEHVVPKV